MNAVRYIMCMHALGIYIYARLNESEKRIAFPEGYAWVGGVSCMHVHIMGGSILQSSSAAG